MKKLAVFVCLISCLLFFSCQPRSIAALKADPIETYSFKVNLGYQAEHRAILAYCDRCISTCPLCPAFVVKSELYSDIKTSEITFINPMANFYAPGYQLHIVVTDNGAGSDVVVYGAGALYNRGSWIESGRCE